MLYSTPSEIHIIIMMIYIITAAETTKNEFKKHIKRVWQHRGFGDSHTHTTA